MGCVAVSENRRPSFPTLSASVWTAVRLRFQRTLPTEVTTTYLQTVLVQSPKSARNILPQLKLVGLVDESGRPTTLANEWRTDDGYRDACRTILEAVYPLELREAVPPEEVDRDAAGRWFMRERQVGSASARVMAAFYAMLAAGELPSPEAPRGAEVHGARPTQAERGASRPTQRSDAAGSRRSAAPPRPQSTATWGEICIAIHLHIAPDSPIEHIDATFASLARHLATLHRRDDGSS
jgi:hypothetical protein